MAEIDITKVVKVYPDGTTAVRGVDLAIADGSFVVLVGPSGCGKTTLLRMIAGLESITGGTIAVGGDLVNDVPPSERDIAMVFQSYALYPHMSVYDNMAFGLRRRKLPKDEIDASVRRAAEMLGLSELLHRKPRALSGGQRQRVAMGRAIVRRPWAFLMDEPLSNLDAKLRGYMRAEIGRLQRELGVTTVYVTHDQTEAMTLGDVVAVMNHGEIQQLAPPQELFDRPCNLFVAAFMGSPSMNLVEVELIDDGSQTVARFGSHSLRVPESVLAERPELATYVGRRVALGIRPEDFAGGTEETPTGSELTVKIDLREPLGRIAHLHFDVDAALVVTDDTREARAAPDDADVADLPTARLVASVSADVPVREEDRVTLRVDTTRLHFFDLETGDAIYGTSVGSHAGAAALPAGA